MRRNGSRYRPDSIQAELERSITTAQGRNYTVESLHTEHSGDLGYDTEDSTSRFRRQLPYRVKKNPWRTEDCDACRHSQSTVEIGASVALPPGQKLDTQSIILLNLHPEEPVMRGRYHELRRYPCGSFPHPPRHCR